MEKTKTFFERLKYFQTKNSEDLLDFIFNTLDDKLINKEFDFCEKILTEINVKDFNTTSLIGILTITAGWRKISKSRSVYFQQVKNKIEKKYSSEEAKLILSNLK